MVSVAAYLGPTSVSPARARLRHLLRSRSFAIGALLVLAMVLVAASADLLAPFDPLRTNGRMRLSPPGAVHWPSSLAVRIAGASSGTTSGTTTATGTTDSAAAAGAAIPPRDAIAAATIPARTPALRLPGMRTSVDRGG